MKKGLVILGDLFEDTELIATIDVLKRHGEQITIASLMNRDTIVSKCGITMKVDTTLEEVSLDDFDFLFIPGGPGAFKIINEFDKTYDTIKYFALKGKLVSAICAAPMLIGKTGLLKDHNFTVYPGFEKEFEGGTYLEDQGVVTDGNFITGKSMYYSIELALAVVEYLYNKEEREKLELSLKAEN